MDSIVHTIKGLILLGILTGGDSITIPYISDGALERTLEHDEAYMPDKALDPPPGSPHRRREIIQKIGAYNTLFPTQLIDIDSSLKGIDLLSVHELEALLGDVQFMVESRQSTKMSRGKFIGGIAMFEGASPLTGLRLEGLSNMAAQSSNLLECVDETFLQYAPSIQDPRHRLGIEFIRMCCTLDAHNRA